MCFKLSPSEINSAFKTLSALIFVFILSWTPYNLLLIIRVLMEPGQKATVCIFLFKDKQRLFHAMLCTDNFPVPVG